MMEFNASNYPEIKAACEKKQGVEFLVEKSATCFENNKAPSDWTEYPPTHLPPEGYAQIFVRLGNDEKGALTRLELLVHLDGGRILYKEEVDAMVAVRIEWPEI